ncbi:hypothetical protein FLONG3_1433 [Fusarium longipes]|uniref:Uncharacterized protein n=1 Tax=Fusarium longipes TaxID=694270 RepID=A0A395T6Q6_9HYPO|nr:hypothetical protein FLONG3_1433 [Fusarium longipes]
MAQDIAVKWPLVSMNELSGLADNQRYQIEQYEKIVRLRDAILLGQHPTIKPSNLNASTNSSSIRPIDISSSHGAPNNQSEKRQQVGVSAPASSSTAKISKPYGAGSTEINPIFLEKSDDLVKAELRLQRQKLERALKEEVDQKKATAKNATQGEPVVEFDLNQVLSEALTRVQSIAGPDTTVSAADATNPDNASDSFDDNTFYSSQHNTPSSVLTSRVRNESEEAQVPASEPRPPINYHSNVISRTLPTDTERVHSEAQSCPQSQPVYSNTVTFTGSLGVDSNTRTGQVPGLTTYNEGKAVSRQDASAGQSPSNLEIDRHRGDYGSAIQQPPREPYIDSRPPSPLRRVNARSPHVRASPLANARRRPLAPEANSTSSTGTPAQVVALRNEPITMTSPESSPQGGRISEKDKRKAKKKKRKADRQAPEAEQAPYIKPEPRSPSPLNAPSYIRPNKRQRYTQQQPDEPDYEEVRYEPHPAQYPPEPLHNRQERDGRMPISYERVGFPSQRAASTAVPGGTVYRREYADDRYAPGGTYAVEQSPLVPAHHQRQSVGGTAGSQARPHDAYQRPSWPYPGGQEASPSALRGEGDVFMAPHRPPPTRIIVDAYGREYIEPPRPTIIRSSAAPHARSGEPEVIYERAPPRRPQGMETYDEGGTVYRRRSPSYMPRRVVTQPEYISQDYRDPRLHEQSSRPLGHPGEFVEVMAPPERRRVEDGTREYIARPASVRPAEPVRYEVARDYGRVQSVRPEVPVRQYAPSVHPENRREAAQPYGREYGALTAEQGVVRQEYSTRPVERYYNQSMRGGEEIAFIEQPRGTTQEIVYADDARREVYR